MTEERTSFAPTCTHVPQRDSRTEQNATRLCTKVEHVGGGRDSQAVIAARDNEGLILRNKEGNLCTDTNRGYNLQAPSNSASAQPLPS
jgi:hypothetical protein